MAEKFLNKDGLTKVWEKVKAEDTKTLNAAKNDATEKVNTAKQTLQRSIGNVETDVTTLKGYFTSGIAKKATSDKNGNDITTTYVPLNAVGNVGGVCPLDQDGVVPAAYLPSYVDDIIEGYYKNDKFYKESAATTQISPSSGIVYVDLSTNKTYRWGGSKYVEISASLALGTRAGTAYDGAAGAKNRSDIEGIKAANPIVKIAFSDLDRSLGIELLNGSGGDILRGIVLDDNVADTIKSLTWNQKTHGIQYRTYGNSTVNTLIDNLVLGNALNDYVLKSSNPIVEVSWDESHRGLVVGSLDGKGGSIVDGIAYESDLATAITTAEIDSICV